MRSSQPAMGCSSSSSLGLGLGRDWDGTGTPTITAIAEHPACCDNTAASAWG